MAHLHKGLAVGGRRGANQSAPRAHQTLGQQSRVRVDVRARLQSGLTGTNVRRPETRQQPMRHETRFLRPTQFSSSRVPRSGMKDSKKKRPVWEVNPRQVLFVL